MFRRLVSVGVAAAAVAALCATPAFAGNIALTGHDDDFHCPSNTTSSDCIQIKQMVDFARAGSTNPSLPILSFDAGTELTSDLTAWGYTFTNISTAGAINASLFDTTKYSAFIVASDNACGGCDNNLSGNDISGALASNSAAVDSFFNSGGGIVGLAGGTDFAHYYSFLPVSAAGGGFPPSNGYVSEGPCFGTPITAVNGDATHNFFDEPGTGGMSPLFCVAERNPSVTGINAVTVLLQGGAIVTSVITTTTGTPIPEPATLTLFGLGAAVAAYRRRRSTKA